MADMEEEESAVGMVEACHHVVALQKLVILTERSQGELHGALERNPHRPKTCNEKLIVDRLYE